MIENVAKMAGNAGRTAVAMDEVALDLGPKIMKATEADLEPTRVNQTRRS
jgi:3-hydroxyacyl-CoA dehydrogenase/enoyl-CoA hydratase/3-hydroxybutyryl-CoA epimerase